MTYRIEKITKIIILLIMTAALALTGAVPSFAAADNNSKDGRMVSSAEIDWEDAPDVEGTSVIMIDGGSGEILYEKNAEERRDPASITKILTCLVVLENMDLDDEITVAEDYDGAGENIAVKADERFTVEQLLYAMMVGSANDAAEVLALAAGGDMETFCDMMNERAKECGAKNTSFTNPNGMNYAGQENHRTTAYDIAMIAREAMKNDTFRKIVSTAEYRIPTTNKSEARNIESTNPCLGLYEGTTGIKTGTTSVAVYCFCGSAKKDDTELIVVNLNSGREQRFSETIKLWDYGFSKYYTYKAAEGGKVLAEERVSRGDKRAVNVGVEEDFDITLNKGYDRKNISLKTDIDEDLKAPIKKGTEVGTITAVNRDGEAVAASPLIALENVDEGGILSYIGIADEDRLFFFAGLAAAVILFMIIVRIIKRMNYRKNKRRRAQRQRNVRRREWEKERNPFDRNV